MSLKLPEGSRIRFALIAAISSIKRELGARWALIVVVMQCVIAWICAFLVHCIFGWFLR